LAAVCRVFISKTITYLTVPNRACSIKPIRRLCCVGKSYLPSWCQLTCILLNLVQYLATCLVSHGFLDNTVPRWLCLVRLLLFLLLCLFVCLPCLELLSNCTLCLLRSFPLYYYFFVLRPYHLTSDSLYLPLNLWFSCPVRFVVFYPPVATGLR
jgi:hypothetical protein